MHIGLIGGIGPAATDYYYRRLIAAFNARQMPLDLTITHADTATLLGNLADNNVAEQAAIFASLTNRLAGAGADCVVVTAIAGHFCIDTFAAISSLPVINMTQTERAQLLHTMTLSAIKQGDVTTGTGLLREAIDTHPQHFEAAVRSLRALEDQSG